MPPPCPRHQAKPHSAPEKTAGLLGSTCRVFFAQDRAAHRVFRQSVMLLPQAIGL